MSATKEQVSVDREALLRFIVEMDAVATVDSIKSSGESPLVNHIYRVIELVGTSEASIEDAITSAISRANSTLRNLRWFEVVRTSGHIVDGAVQHYQVTLKVGFTMENSV